jgi:hypothetical protein
MTSPKAREVFGNGGHSRETRRTTSGYSLRYSGSQTDPIVIRFLSGRYKSAFNCKLIGDGYLRQAKEAAKRGFSPQTDESHAMPTLNSSTV